MASREVSIRFGPGRLTLEVPEHADILSGPTIPRLPDPEAAVRSALQNPIGSASLRAVAERVRPGSVVITMSDITRPVPNELLITAILEELNAAGVPDAACTILIATGMHRASLRRPVRPRPDPDAGASAGVARRHLHVTQRARDRCRVRSTV